MSFITIKHARTCCVTTQCVTIFFWKLFVTLSDTFQYKNATLEAKSHPPPNATTKKMHYHHLVSLLLATCLLLHVSYGLDTIGQVYTANDTSVAYNFPGYRNSTTKLSMYLDWNKPPFASSWMI